VRYAVDYPDRDLNRLATAFRIFTIIPIAIVLGTIGGFQGGGDYDGGTGTTTIAVGGTGLLFLPPIVRGSRSCSRVGIRAGYSTTSRA